jgi:O-antigen/teichoic acid export membrane protein
MQILKIFFQNIEERQIVFKNTFWFLLNKFLSYILRGLSLIVAARILGPSNYGIFSSVFSFCNIFRFFSDFGLTTTITKNVSEFREKRTLIFLNSFILFLLISILSFLIAYFLFDLFLKPSLKSLFFVIFFGLILDLLREIASSFLIGLEKMEIPSILKILINLFSFLGVFFYLRKNPTPISLGYIYFWIFLLGAIVILFFVFKHFNKLNLKDEVKISLKIISYLFKDAWIFGLGNVLFFININLTILILSKIFDPKLVGIYSAALRFYEALTVIPISFTAAILPTMIRKKEKIGIFLEKILRIFHLIFWPLLFGSFLVGKDLIILLFGNDYQQSFYPFLILMLGFLFNSYISLFITALTAIGKRKEMLIFDFLSIFIVIILSLILIPKFSIYGASFVHLLSFFVLYIFSNLTLKKFIKFNSMPKFLNYLLASFLMAIFIYFLGIFNLGILNLGISWSVIFKIFFGIIFYFSFLYLIKDEIILDIKKLRNY